MSAAGNGHPGGQRLHAVFARNVRKLAAERSHTQVALARAAGIPAPNLNRMLHGQLAVTLYYLEALADALEVTPAELITDTEQT